MSDEKKPYLYLNAFLVKKNYSRLKFPEFIKKDVKVKSYDLDEIHGLEGMLFIKIPVENKPSWSGIAEELAGEGLDELSNRSSSAVLIIKSTDEVMAFTFGYGRHLVDTKYFVYDFGIKTALNILDHSSLRSVDLFSLDDQAVQKKTQAARESEVSIFGIDISKDILRAVTGSPKEGVELHNISGADLSLSFSIRIDIKKLTELVSILVSYYKESSYKENFSWVDNIRRVKEKSELKRLDSLVVDSIRRKSSEIVITLPEIVSWDNIYGFSFTRSKHNITPMIDTQEYLKNIDSDKVNIDSIKRDRIYVYDISGNNIDYAIYQSIYYEIKEVDKTHILFSGVWYEIENSFISRIDKILQDISLSKLVFPKVYVWSELKDGEVKQKIETEGNYNKRVSESDLYHLLDCNLIKSNRTTTAIELCDLMTDHKQFIHVKHRKGGSAGLSHLFAQGSVSAEILLGDREFRKATRRVLKKVKEGLQDIVSLDSFKSEGVEIVFLILGEDSGTLKQNLPFFSKVNLSKTYENLSQRGFTMTIAGVDKIEKPDIVI